MSKKDSINLDYNIEGIGSVSSATSFAFQTTPVRGRGLSLLLYPGSRRASSPGAIII